MRRPFLQIVSSLMQRWDRYRSGMAIRYTTDHNEKVRSYNLSVGERKITTTRRAEELYKLLTIKGTDDVLICGPRDVHELYMAWCYGASWGRITGLDLSSRNPKILVGDMANTPFPSEHFDVIVSAFTISYLEDVYRGLAEMYRILRPGGMFAFTHTHDKDSDWAGNHASSPLMYNWLALVGFHLHRHWTTEKISAQGRRVEIMTCVVVK